MRRLFTLAARLAGEIRASGWRVAARKSVRHVVGPRVVVRSGTANPHKDLPLFILVAAKGPNHRFVLSACWSIGYPDHLEAARLRGRHPQQAVAS